MKARLLALSLLTAGCGAREESRDISAGEVANAFAAVTIEPGLWETTSAVTAVSAPDLPYEVRRRMIGPRPSARGCIAPAQAGRLIAGRGCRYSDFTMREGRLRGTMSCPESALPRPTITTMEGRYGPRRYDFTMRMETVMADGALMIVDIRGQGRRIGDCPAAAT